MRFQDYFIPCVISSIQAYYWSRSSCLSLLSFQITSGSCIVCNGTLTIESEATFSESFGEWWGCSTKVFFFERQAWRSLLCSTLLNGGSRHFVTVSKTLFKILRQLVASQSNAICACVSCLLSDYVNHVHIAHCLQLIDCDTWSGAIKIIEKATVE